MALKIDKNTRIVITTSIKGKTETIFFNRDYIGNEFKGDETLKEIEICDDVTQIRDEAFKDCTSLTTVILPSSLNRIGFNAFISCSALQEIIVQGLLEEVVCCFDARGVSKMTLNKPSSKELIDYLQKGFAMDLNISKVDMSFPIVGWKSQKRVLWDAFNDGEQFFGKEAFNKEKDDLYCLQPQPNFKVVGIDVPVLLSNGKGEKGTIMIIAESPVRDTRSVKKNGLYIGTPFAVAQKFNVPSQCKIYKFIFCKLLDAGYNVYITDAVKEWHKGLKKKEFVNHIDYSVLKAEIENVKPILIVTWGETAKVACKKCGVKPFPQMHPVILNWDRWKVKMLKDTIVNGSGIGKNYIDDLREDKVKDPIYLAEYISQEILNNVH